jgi:hypothetical protein
MNNSRKRDNKKEEIKEKVKQSAKELFIRLFEGAENVYNFVEQNPYHAVSIQEYARRKNLGSDVRNHVYYLEKQGLIKTFMKNKEKYAELTDKGFKQINWKLLDQLKKRRPEKWDGKFRMVMFDIPEEKRNTRDVVRRKLETIGFKRIQESVFLYPFECKQEIDSLCFFTGIDQYLVYMIVDISLGEENVIEHFLEQKILRLSDLKR